MIKIKVVRQKPTKTRALKDCQFSLRMFRGNAKITWNTELFTRRSGAVQAARAMRSCLSVKCAIIDDLGNTVR